MHELSIASAILDQLTAERERRAGVRIAGVGVRVGALSGVDPDALAFGFSVLVKDTAWEPLTLHIEFVKRRQQCPACNTSFIVQDWETACPNCAATNTATIAGDELDVAYIEVEDE
jgi:hydrogenase nickel incorporation protein HypA/HybF